ncbi:MAG: penicillin-binding protein 2 [Bacteroidaceae bacterium]|jgi:penicillin-binding protein 2
MEESHQYENRKFVISGFVIGVVLIYMVRLFLLQISTDDYKKNAASNALLKRVEYPSRGIIYDRKGRLLVYNQPMYDVMVVVSEIKDLDTLDFCRTVKITKEEFDASMAEMKDRNKNPGYSRYTHQLFLSMLTAEECGVLQEKLFKFRGFYVRQRNIRQYNSPIASHLLGDVGEISQRELDRDTVDYYSPGDYVGKAGIERYYEEELRGTKGVKILLRDVRGRIKGQYMDGAYDQKPIPGKNLTLTIDSGLQALGERLMQHKIGAIVAIEPSTGEILCMVSSPTYDLRLMSGKQRRKTYSRLFTDPYKPLYNRAVQGVYPPGSTFKPAQGLIYLQEGIVNASTPFPCPHGFRLGRLKVGCHGHASPISLVPAISTSCNAYFCWGLYYMMRSNKYPNADSALTVWKDHMVSMGFGYKLGTDLYEEVRGFIPNANFYDKRYGAGRWTGATIIHIGIGQAEIGLTPLQIANLGATIANRGYFITPHLVRSIENGTIDERFRTPRHTTVEPQYYDLIREGMRSAAIGGTCHWLNTMPELQACGKTGTAQNKGRDHGAFMGFAPKDNPRIAIAVYVENGGFGATFAVPIGGLLMQQYLEGKLSERNEAVAERISNTVIHYGIQER